MGKAPGEGPERDALIALDRGDHKTALTILMDAYGKRLFGYCRQMLGDPALAEDVHQLVFIQAYEALGRFSRRSTIRTWLYGIARHRCLDAIKSKRRRQKRYESVGELPDEADAVAAVDERLEAGEITSLVEKCLQKLAPHIRLAVLLRYQENLSYQEMKRICHERSSTLQARVSRAMPVLRRCIEAHGGRL